MNTCRETTFVNKVHVRYKPPADNNAFPKQRALSRKQLRGNIRRRREGSKPEHNERFAPFCRWQTRFTWPASTTTYFCTVYNYVLCSPLPLAAYLFTDF